MCVTPPSVWAVPRITTDAPVADAPIAVAPAPTTSVESTAEEPTGATQYPTVEVYGARNHAWSAISACMEH